MISKIFNSIFRSIGITTIITIAFLFVYIDFMTNDEVLYAFVLWTIFGFVGGFISLIPRDDSNQLFVRSLVTLVLFLLSFVIAMYVLFTYILSIEINILSMVIAVIMFIIIYIVIWLVFYFKAKSQVQKINGKLDELKK